MKGKLEELINKLIWTHDIEKCKFTITHRGAPRNKKIIKGSEISGMKRKFLITKEGEIPIHRIKKIQKGEKILWP